MNKEDLKAIRELLKEELKTTRDLLRDELKAELDPIKSQLKENTQILKALEHKADVHKAEHDKINNNIAHVEGHLKNIDGKLDLIELAVKDTLKDVKDIREDLTSVELITAKNYTDIVKLKSVK
ncbi:hypothetical protein ACJDU8_22335 [Clostridium sp. WILCCON 0269]|uniref:Uncharacterized protein n=1 Tax=Candidatus Clostridium eludens TaxID=3381663 RepID=A0ABW8SSZ9_9CLOT